jgi:hypothetical protein
LRANPTGQIAGPVLYTQNTPSQRTPSPRDPAAGRITAKPYSVLRIGFALVMLADIGHLYVDRDLFVATSLWPQFPVGPLCLIWFAALTALICGFRTRTAALVNWICCTIMLGW